MTTKLSSCKTLIDLLQFNAAHSSEATAFIIDENKYTYSWLWENVKYFASTLISKGVNKKETVLILVPNSAEFFIAFYGCILAGAIAVPVFPKAGTDRCLQLKRLCKSQHMILSATISSKRKVELLAFAKKQKIKLHWVNKSLPVSSLNSFPKISENNIAFIQYTSGSTSFPKGVPLTHKKLLINIKQNIDAMNITNKDVFVSWLPVYHDMGLILNTMVPLYTGGQFVLLAEGLHKVHSWLSAIQKFKGTIITAPDIAYQLCVKSIRNHSSYDLSSLRLALNAAEPIHIETYRLFEKAFNLKNIMIAGYGLAEATLAVTTHPVGQPPRTDKDGHVSSGKLLKNIKIKIASVKQKKEKRKIGEVLVKSPANMKGYFNKKKKYSPFDKNNYLRTGDIGYLDKKGYLYILSRKKNIIIHGGITLYPDDIEEVVRKIKNIRQAMAIGIEKPEKSGEKLYVFAEYKQPKCTSIDKCHELVIEIVQSIYEHFGLRPAKVYLLKPKALPITPNGKLRHSSLKNVYLDSPLVFRKNILVP